MRIKPNTPGILFLVLFFGCCTSGHTQYWQQHVDYSIYATLTPSERLIHGFQRIIYTNNSPDTLSEIYLHLYPNGFKSGSIMDKEAKAASIKLINSSDETGYLKFQLLLTATPPPFYQEIKVKAEYNEDSTVAKLTLEPKLLPAKKIELSVKFEMKIRRFNTRYDKSGYQGQMFEISLWYPKVCVYDQNGWDNSPLHYLGEFYGEFGTYNVTIDVPDSFIVAGTGTVISGDPGWKEVAFDSTLAKEKQQQKHISQLRRVVTFHADNVHDFVWTASTDYIYEEGKWNDLNIHILYQKSSLTQWNKQALQASKQAVAWLEKNIGAFPYPDLTVAQGLTDGGMEYPMMAVLGYYDFVLVFHEIAHSYFYAALGNNEHKNGWLDEGLVTYLADLYRSEKFGKQVKEVRPVFRLTNLDDQFKPYHNFSDVQLNSLYYYLYSGFDQPLNGECHKLNNLYLYSYHVYVKPTKFFAILDYLMGRENFIKILQTYYQEWKFKHVDLSSLQSACEKISGDKLDCFFYDWINSTPKIDYALSQITNQRQNDKIWKTELTIKKLGNSVLPVEIQAITTKYDTITKIWDGHGEQKTLTFLSEAKTAYVRLDPRDIILDQNRFNNGTPQFKLFLYPDFPSMYYLPRDAYSLFFWPRVWYNKIDGAKVGIKLFGSYLNHYYVTRNYCWYNLKSQQVDYHFAYSMPWDEVNKNLWRHIILKKMEGRFSLNFNLNYNIVQSFAQPPTHNFRVGFFHCHLFDESYFYRPLKIDHENYKVAEWEAGNINKIYFTYILDNSVKNPHFKAETNFQFASRSLNSDFDYAKLSAKLEYDKISTSGKIRWQLRGFWGIISPANHLPVQDRFGVAGTNPIEKFDYYYLSSPGSIPNWLNYHLPGDGNLRGYLNEIDHSYHFLSSRKLLTANLDITIRRLHLLVPAFLTDVMAGIDLKIFGDGGWISLYQTTDKLLFDAGIGLAINKIIFGKLRKIRLEFPLWLSQPNFNNFVQQQSNWSFRWLMSCQ